MSATLSPCQEDPYGVARVCRAWEVPRSSFYDWRRLQAMPAKDRPAPLKRGPKTERSDHELAELIRALLCDTEAEAGITGEGYRKAHAWLRFAGARVGRERILRVMREHGLLAPTRTGRCRGPRVHDGTVTTDRPDLMWETDATRIATRLDGDVWAFAAVDHCNTECVGIHAAKARHSVRGAGPGAGRRPEALWLDPNRGRRQAQPAARPRNAVHEPGLPDGLRFLGIESGLSFVAAPEGNGVAERFFRILEEQLLWVRTFDTAEDLRLALLDFQRRYNERWILARHGYRTPSQVRNALTAIAA